MMISLLKDLRAGKTPLLLMVGTLLGIAVASLLLGIKNAAGLTPMLLFVGGHYLGAFALGHEFDHRTWALQLTQPTHRWRLWSSKLGLSFGVLLICYLLTVMVMELTQPRPQDFRWFVGMFALAAFSGPPLFVQYTRSTLGAAALSFLMLILLITGTSLTLELLLYRVIPITGRSVEVAMEIAIGSYSVIALGLATWKWRRLELREGTQRRSLFPRRNWLPPFLRMRRSTPVRNIWLREALLQSRNVAFGILFSVALWVDMRLLQSSYWSPYAGPMLPVLMLLPGWVVPLFAGLSCGNGRFERTEFLSFSQPLEAWKQLGIRLCLGLATVLTFGGLVSYWAVSAAQAEFAGNVAALDWEILGVTALICFVAGWFSATIANSSLSAAGLSASLLGTVIGGLVMLHEWVIPWLVVFSGLVKRPANLLPEWGPASSYWNVGFLLNELHDHPVNQLWFTGSMLAFITALLAWTVRNSRYDHTPKTKGFKLFGIAFGFVVLIQVVLGSHLCLEFLKS